MDDIKTKEELEFLEDMISLDSKPRPRSITLQEEFEMLVSDQKGVHFSDHYHSPEFKAQLKKARDEAIHNQRKRTFKLIKSE